MAMEVVGDGCKMIEREESQGLLSDTYSGNKSFHSLEPLEDNWSNSRVLLGFYKYATL